MTADEPATIRMFGLLHTLRKKKGLPVTVDLQLPPQGRTARDIAQELKLPADRIEAVFCNHLAYPLDHVILPGDRVAFIPHGTPGPHRYCLGIKQAGDRSHLLLFMGLTKQFSSLTSKYKYVEDDASQ